VNNLAADWLTLAQTSGGGGFWLVVILGALGMGGAALYEHRRRRKKRADLDRRRARSPGLTYTVIPCGLRNDELAWWCQGLPTGDRNNGVRWAIEGPMTLDLGPGMPTELTVATFQWWWEEERRDRRRTDRGTMTTRRRYAKRTTPAAVVKLPLTVDNRVIVRPESVLGRVGITRDGHQFESAEFNRRFRVEAMEHNLALALVDANFQQLMVEHFPDQTVEFFGALLLVAGTPTHRDESLTGVIGHLPALRQDANQILRAVPPAYWRAVGAVDRSL
jgi:hypothetical protein